MISLNPRVSPSSHLSVTGPDKFQQIISNGLLWCLNIFETWNKTVKKSKFFGTSQFYFEEKRQREKRFSHLSIIWRWDFDVQKKADKFKSFSEVFYVFRVSKRKISDFYCLEIKVWKFSVLKILTKKNKDEIYRYLRT